MVGWLVGCSSIKFFFPIKCIYYTVGWLVGWSVGWLVRAVWAVWGFPAVQIFWEVQAVGVVQVVLAVQAAKAMILVVPSGYRVRLSFLFDFFEGLFLSFPSVVPPKTCPRSRSVHPRPRRALTVGRLVGNPKRPRSVHPRPRRALTVGRSEGRQPEKVEKCSSQAKACTKIGRSVGRSVTLKGREVLVPDRGVPY